MHGPLISSMFINNVYYFYCIFKSVLIEDHASLRRIVPSQWRSKMIKNVGKMNVPYHTLSKSLDILFIEVSGGQHVCCAGGAGVQNEDCGSAVGDRGRGLAGAGAGDRQSSAQGRSGVAIEGL